MFWASRVVGERCGTRNSTRGRLATDTHAMGFGQGDELLGGANACGNRRAVDDADTARGVSRTPPVWRVSAGDRNRAQHLELEAARPDARRNPRSRAQ